MLSLSVTPFVGVWIETYNLSGKAIEWLVTPFVGVWIETYYMLDTDNNEVCHTLRGCVD